VSKKVKKEREERNKSILKHILASEFAKEWIHNDIDFYKTKRPDKEMLSDLISDFLAEDLEQIVKVLPEIWDEIKQNVKEELEWMVFESPKMFEEYVGGTSFREHISVPFSLSDYLEALDVELQKTLKTTPALLEGIILR